MAARTRHKRGSCSTARQPSHGRVRGASVRVSPLPLPPSPAGTHSKHAWAARRAPALRQAGSRPRPPCSSPARPRPARGGSPGPCATGDPRQARQSRSAGWPSSRPPTGRIRVGGGEMGCLRGVGWARSHTRTHTHMHTRMHACTCANERARGSGRSKPGAPGQMQRCPICPRTPHDAGPAQAGRPSALAPLCVRK